MGIILLILPGFYGLYIVKNEWGFKKPPMYILSKKEDSKIKKIA